MISCVLLTTDTLHHRYLANFLNERCRTTVILENRPFPYKKSYVRELKRRKNPVALIDNPYLHLPHPRFTREEHQFEEQNFFPETEAKFPDVEMHQVWNANDPDSVAAIRDAEPDLLISFGTGLLKQPVLEIECLKVNIHRGIVPRYRGLDSDLWAFYHRDFGNVGTTVHEIDPQLDTGVVVGQERLELRPGMRVFHVRYHTTILAAQILGELIESQLRSPRRAQDLTEGTYYSFIPPVKRSLAIRRFDAHVKGLTA